MRTLLPVLLLAALPAWAQEAPSGCGPLCGEWTLDATRSDQVEPLVEAALKDYKPPRTRRPRLPEPMNGAQAVANAQMESSLEELMEPPDVTELRKDLLRSLPSRATLRISGRNAQILIGAGELPDRIVEPGRPHSRVDVEGTAEIKTRWKSGALVITEKYDRKRELVESYKIQVDGTLAVDRLIERPGLKDIRVQSVYVRSAGAGPGAG